MGGVGAQQAQVEALRYGPGLAGGAGAGRRFGHLEEVLEPVAAAGCLGRGAGGSGRLQAGDQALAPGPFHSRPQQRGGGLGRVGATDVFARAAAPLGGLLRVLEGLPHQRRGPLEVRLGPLLVGRVGVGAGADLGHLVGDEEAVVLGHEVEVARVGGGDRRPAEVHRLRHRQAEALGAVQGDVAIAAGDHRVLDPDADHLLGQVDFGTVADGVGQFLALGGEFLAADRLDYQRGARARLEGVAERLDDPERVLAAEDAAVVEEEEEAEAVGHAQLGPACRRRRRRRYRHPHGVHRGDRERPQRVGDVLGGDPDFVDVFEGAAPLLEEVGDLPEPEPGRVTAGEEVVAERGRDVGQHVGVDAEQVEVVGVVGFRQSLQLLSDLRRVGGGVDRRHRQVVGAQGGEHLPRRLADPALGADVADDVGAGLGPGRPRLRGAVAGSAAGGEEFDRDPGVGSGDVEPIEEGEAAVWFDAGGGLAEVGARVPERLGVAVDGAVGALAPADFGQVGLEPGRAGLAEDGVVELAGLDPLAEHPPRRPVELEPVRQQVPAVGPAVGLLEAVAEQFLGVFAADPDQGGVGGDVDPVLVLAQLGRVARVEAAEVEEAQLLAVH